MTRRYAVLTAERSASTRDPFMGPGLESVSLEPPVVGVEVVDLTASEVRDMARDRRVAAMCPIMPLKLIAPVAVAGTEAVESAWGITAIGADQTLFDGTGVTVAVLDTGIDDQHPAFAGVNLVQRDFSGSGNGDGQGHGTHCAGTIFGRDVAGKRIGIARGVKRAVIGKVLGNNGGGESDWLFQGIQWALDQGAQVISMSLGFDFPGMVSRLVDADWPTDLATSVGLEAYRGNLRVFDALMSLVAARRALDGGCVVVAATGNESQRQIKPEYELAASLPAAAEGVVSVGALERRGADKLGVADFSNTLAQISAPGVGILSAKAGGGLRVLSGTSMATPHVAGVAALWWQALRSALVPVNAGIVTAKLLAGARVDVFATGVDIADRGVGLATCPV